MASSSYDVWRTLRRPFRYPRCVECRWELFDSNAAGCLKCGAHHLCASNAIDSKCPLAQNDDGTRVCTITGLILPEVHYAKDEYMDTCVAAPGPPEPLDVSEGVCLVEHEVTRVVERLLLGSAARRYREEENARQSRKVASGLHKCLRQAKLRGLVERPNICRYLAETMYNERGLRFVSAASGGLAQQCMRQIIACLLDLRAKGVKFVPGPRLDGLVCGLLYLLRTGLTYKSNVLLRPIEEIGPCLPHENRLKTYFNISSKVLTEVENELKLVYRAFYQYK